MDTQIIERSLKKPLVSVVIACYMHEKYIVSALESVKNQSYDRLELIVIDDASQDDSFAKIQSICNVAFCDRFERVLISRNSVNRGAHACLNKGIALSSGEYISFLNSDDMYAADRIAKLVTVALNDGSEFLFTAVCAIGHDGVNRRDHSQTYGIIFEPKQFIECLPCISWALMHSNVTISTGNFFISRFIAERVGRFKNLKYCHDWDFAVRASFFTEPKFLDENLYFYRVHDSNSFLSLGNLAGAETRIVLTDHLIRTKIEKPINLLCASRQNWPTTFESWAYKTQLRDLIKEEYEPYENYHRTVTEGAYAPSAHRRGG